VREIVVSIVGAQLISPVSARNPGDKIRAKALIRTTRTKAEGKQFRSSKGVSISPLLQNFLRAHQ
jgi:hypothetical protein